MKKIMIAVQIVLESSDDMDSDSEDSSSEENDDMENESDSEVMSNMK